MALPQGMNFWEWLTQPQGLIQGDPTYYSEGRATPAEYAHALRVAINNLATASDPTAAATFWNFMVSTGAIQGDPTFYSEGRAQPGEIENAINVATTFFTEVPAGETTVQPPGEPSIGGPSIPPPPSPPPIPPPPSIPPEEPPEPIDFRARAQALFPWLPPALLNIYAEAWAKTGNPSLALAEIRASPQYNDFFPGNKRDDGSLRLSEAEYLARIDGFKLALSQFNLNPANFSSRFVEMIEGELTATQFASRLSSAFDDIITAMPEIREFYSDNFGIGMTDEAIFASFLDPDLGDAIINRRISQAQIGGAGAASGFNIDLAFTEELRQQGLGLAGAQTFFGDAAFQVPTLSRLATRFGLDRTFDVTEFAAGTILGDPTQRRRIQRLFGAETSSFSERLGTVRTEEDLTLSGLSPR